MKGEFFPDIDLNKLNLPPAELKIVRRNGVFKVFDRLRKNYFCLTEEEFIRQIFVDWLISTLHYPSSLMANEIGINLNGTKKRCDTVVFSKEAKPLVIVEYKSPKIKINQEVFDQIVRYNMVLDAKYLIVSNGITHYCCKIDNEAGTYSYLTDIPDYLSIIS